MTSRTHDLIAFTTLTYIVATNPVPKMTLATAFVALAANMLGAIAPDLDQPTAGLWQSLPTGSIIGRIVHPFLGAHRTISHSLLGLVLVGFGLKFVLGKVGAVLLVDMNIVWWTFMIGFFSHLVADTITKEGVPWFFPVPWKIGFPPFDFLRITTGGLIERFVIFPGFLILNGYLIYNNYHVFLGFIKNNLIR